MSYQTVSTPSTHTPFPLPTNTNTKNLATPTNPVIQNALNPMYPTQPGYCTSCPVNTTYQTLPPEVAWETIAFNPTVKHLYSGVPNYYPYQRITRPVGTLYEQDFSQIYDIGSSTGKRMSYQPKLYPFTNRNIKEVREYSDQTLPYMDWRAWTKHEVKRDSSLNSGLFTFPNKYVPDRD